MSKKYSVFVRDGSAYSTQHVVLVDVALRQKSLEYDQSDIDRLFMALDVDPLPFDVSFVTDEHLFASDANYDVVFAFSPDAQILFLSFICKTLDAKRKALAALEQIKAIEQ